MIILTNIKEAESYIFTTKTGAAKYFNTTDQTILKYLTSKKLFRKVFLITEAEITKNQAKKRAQNWLKSKN
jgi:hypothetical protein